MPLTHLRRSTQRAIVIVALLLAAVVATGTDAAPGRRATVRQREVARRQKIQTLKARLHSLAEKKHEARLQLRQTKKTQVRLSDQLNASYQRLEEANAALEVSRERLQQAETAVGEAGRRLETAEIHLADQHRRFGRRIALSYMRGPASSADMLVGAKDVSDFLDREYYVSKVVRRDAELLARLRAAQAEVARERAALLVRQADLGEAHQENRARATGVARQAAERERLLRAVRRERVLQEQQLEELEEDSNDVRHSLERELARRIAHPRSFAPLPRWSGKLCRPADGPVGSGFGLRYHPILHYYRMHTGVDIHAGLGAPVRAATDGEVFFASWRGGYGQCIIVLHGEGMSTLYGHLSRIAVRPGERVRRGQVIGAVGSTGLSTGPHLHFEVRRNGVPVNPL